MLLCPISPHLAHPCSLHCGALSQAVSSFWSQQQCHSINPLAGYAAVYKRCCFLSYKSLNIVSVLLPIMQPGTQTTSFRLGCLPSMAGPVHSLQCGRYSQNIYARVLMWDGAVFQLLKVTFPKKEKPFAQTKGHLFWVGVNPVSLIKLYLIYNCMRGDSGS